MPFEPNMSFDLIDQSGHCIGRVWVKDDESDVVVGKFFRTGTEHEALFTEWQEAVEDQRLSDVDRLDRRIAELMITGIEVITGCRRAIHDLQIWPDGSTSFRFGETIQAGESEVA